MDEGEALRNYCRVMMTRVRAKELQPFPSSEESWRRRTHGGARGTDRDLTEADLPLADCTGRGRGQASPSPCPRVNQPVPLQLIAMLKLKTFREQLKRAAEVELRDPAVCSVCEQERASLALKTFIRRKKTQLQQHTLKGRLNTHWKQDTFKEAGANIPQSPPVPLSGFGRNYLVKICGSQKPGVALATTKERGVALATDEMRGYPDKNATGTHLARPCCPFSDR